MTSKRSDIVFDGSVTTDSSGNYVFDWIESSGIKTITVWAKLNFQATIDYSTDGTTVLHSEILSAPTDAPQRNSYSQYGPEALESLIWSRYFRVSFAGGTGWAGQPFDVIIRSYG